MHAAMAHFDPQPPLPANIFLSFGLGPFMQGEFLGF